MATILIEGFDKYGPENINSPVLSSLLSQSGWNLTTNGFGDPTTETTIIPGLSGVGQAIQLSPSSGESSPILNLNKTLANNYSRIIGGFRFTANYPTDIGLIGFMLTDNITPQCSVWVRPLSGFISITEGNNGTVLATSIASVAYNTVHYLEFDITFGVGGAGAYSIWLDGVRIIVGTGTTQQSANAYCNVFQFSARTSTGQVTTAQFDDMYLFDDTTGFNFAALQTNPVVLTQWPTGDNQTQFTNTGNVFGNTYSADASSYTMSANTLYLAQFSPNVNCTVNSIIILPNTTNALANFKGVIYADNADVPGSLLSGGTQVTGCVSGTELILPLVTPQSLIATTPYWIGLIGNTSINLAEFDGGILGFTVANTYTSGAPSTAPSMTGNQPSILLYGACTGAVTNWESEALNPVIGDISAVTTSAADTEDLYIFPNLPATVEQVYSVCVSGNCRLVSAGSHTISLVASSSGTSGTGSNAGQSPTTSYAWFDSFFDTDPNTTLAWSSGAVNIAYFGMEVAS